ncbi:hypothetical protein [Agaribacterium sp. ZY112]|uniref:hypothetical protein n=1 Tax=Agaribacterium sp. ZY112 TaxID=3233574 RepID=UPI00352474B5
MFNRFLIEVVMGLSRFFFLSTILSVFLSACSGFPGEKSIKADVSIAEPDRIRFSGKGAGAGLMLSSSMGAMGIAIGVAIDEGIAKEIDASAVKAGFSAKDEVLSALSQTSIGYVSGFSLIVKKYGFTLEPGSDDQMYAYWSLETNFDDGGRSCEWLSDRAASTISLDKSKAEADEVKQALKLELQALLVKVDQASGRC